MVRKLAAFAAVALVALPAWCAEVAGVKLADKASVAGQELALNGAGIRTRCEAFLDSVRTGRPS